MKQTLITCVVFSVAAAFSGCGDAKRESVQDAKESSQSKSIASTEPSAETNSSETTSGKSTNIVFGDKFPEVLKVETTSSDGAKWRFNVTLSSTYDSPQRYADAWRVLDDSDQELGIRVLGHDHAAEQPFTRSETIEIPSDIKVVFVEGRDQANGWSGQRFEFQMPTLP